MAEVTTAETRALIRRALDAGVTADGAATRFHEAARRGKAAFDAEVEPLQLPERKYRQVVRESGLRQVSDLAQRIEEAMVSIQSDRSA